MPPDEEQTQAFAGAKVAQATAEPPSGRATPEPASAADPLASTLSMRPDPAAAAAAPRLAAQVGRELGAVRLLREVGRGSTGSVFLGHHTVLGRDVAVKFLVNVRSSPEDPAGLKRFLDEARAAAAVRHPHLTQIYHADVDDADGAPYLVLEYVHGPTLKQLLDQAGPLDRAAAVAVIGDVAAAVHELHAHGLIHRDIKPSNVLLDADAHVYVTDFGLAVRRSLGPVAAGPGPGSAGSTEFAGTPAYMAPEMFDGRVSARSDVYALGVMAYQLLAGAVPFSGAFEELRDRHARQPLPSDALRAREVPPEVIDVVERATHKQPMFRYKTPLDFSRAMKQAAGCADADLARARKRLCDCVAGRPLARVDSSDPPSRSGPALDDDAPSSTSYPEFLARFATIRRERRTQAPSEGHETRPPADGSDRFKVAPASPQVALTPVVANLATPAIAVENTGEAGSQADDETQPPVAPAPLLSVAVLGIIYGSLLAAWLVGEAAGSMAFLVPALGPPMNAVPMSVAAWRVLVAAVGLIVAGVLVTASAGCFRLKRWARPLMVSYAVVDLAFQVLVLLTVFAWAGPVTLNATAAHNAELPAGDRTAQELWMYVAWLVRWLALSLFPAAVLAVMTRRQVRDAFGPGARAGGFAVETPPAPQPGSSGVAR